MLLTDHLRVHHDTCDVHLPIHGTKTIAIDPDPVASSAISPATASSASPTCS